LFERKYTNMTILSYEFKNKSISSITKNRAYSWREITAFINIDLSIPYQTSLIIEHLLHEIYSRTAIALSEHPVTRILLAPFFSPALTPSIFC